MIRYIIRRLAWAVVTLLGVMLATFILFREIAGDVSAAFVNQKLGAEARFAFYEKHKLDRPAVFNVHRRLQLVDNTRGRHMFAVQDSGRSQVRKALGLHIAATEERTRSEEDANLRIVSHFVAHLDRATPLAKMAQEVPPLGRPEEDAGETSGAWTRITTSDGTSFVVDVSGVETCGELIEAVNAHPENNGACRAVISEWTFGDLFDSQFFWHLLENITFQGRSYATDQTILEIISERARFSLALTIPAMALGWMLALGLSCLVAYYRDTWIDRSVVILAVLGMCVPYLAYMLFGQMIMFRIAPELAVGLSHPMSIYVPVMISVVAGIGVSVRFYRTVILDQVNQDYVRTARAKGVPLPTILFVHVLRNSMLPILTNLVVSIPFLIMGSLLLESFFGIPGLGDLMLTSISSRDVPIITGLTFLTSVLYVIGLLATDVLYATFDPRIRLQ